MIRNGEAEAAFPDGKGELKVGPTKLPPGTLIHVPETEQEVIDALKKAGAQFAP